MSDGEPTSSAASDLLGLRKTPRMSDAYTEPLEVIAIRNAVIVSAGAGASAITPDAALETARRLVKAARLAASDTLAQDDLND